MDSINNMYCYGMQNTIKSQLKKELDYFMNKSTLDGLDILGAIRKSVLLSTSCRYGVDKILEYSYDKNKDIFYNNSFGELLFAELIQTTQYYHVPQKEIDNAIKKYFFITSPHKCVVPIDQDFDIRVDFSNITSTWACTMIDNYKHQLKKYTYDVDTLSEYYKLLYNVSTFDFRKGIRNYGIYILYFGINNIGEMLLNSNVKKQVLDIDKTGIVYKELLEFLGKEDMEYIETVCRMV
jgi:hypothetical protein